MKSVDSVLASNSNLMRRHAGIPERVTGKYAHTWNIEPHTEKGNE